MPNMPKRWYALFFLTLGAFLSPLDYFIVNIALPEIGHHFNASNTSLQLIIVAYGLTYAVLVICGGRFGDIFGRRKVFIYGLYVFLFASIACALSPSIPFLIGARIIQGIGAALLAPQVLSNIRAVFPIEEQAKAIAIFGSVFGFAAILGQLLGGFLIQTRWLDLTWQWVFLINIPVAIGCIIGVHQNLPETSLFQKVKIDYIGIALIITALFSIIYPLVIGRESGWSVWIFITITSGLLLFYLFLRYESKLESSQKTPLLYPSLLQNRAFVSGLYIILLYNFTAGFFICYPYYLQQFLSWSSLESGLAVLPYGIGFFLAPILSTKFSINSLTLARTGLILLIIGTIFSAVLFLVNPTPGLPTYIGLLVAGAGHGTVMPALLKKTMTTVSIQQAGQASGIISTSIQIGSVLGGAIIGSIFFTLTDVASPPIALATALTMIGFFQIIGLGITFTYKRLINIQND